jgi:hypothetical protein
MAKPCSAWKAGVQTSLKACDAPIAHPSSDVFWVPTSAGMTVLFAERLWAFGAAFPRGRVGPRHKA